MAKTGRNQPCPCGSSKKYKHCCLARDEAAGRAALAPRPSDDGMVRLPDLPDDIADELTEASNAVVDLIHAGKLDDAERAAHALLDRFPEVHDGYDRLGMLCEARGDHRLAADYYRKVIAMIRSRPDDYDPDFEAIYQELVRKLDPAATG